MLNNKELKIQFTDCIEIFGVKDSFIASDEIQEKLSIIKQFFESCAKDIQYIRQIIVSYDYLSYMNVEIEIEINIDIKVNDTRVIDIDNFIVREINDIRNEFLLNILKNDEWFKIKKLFKNK